MKLCNFLIGSLAVVLTACGGGGSTIVTPPVQPPVQNITYSLSSYENSKNPGFYVDSLQLQRQINARTFFKYTDGTAGLITTSLNYVVNQHTASNSPPATLTLWKQANGTWSSNSLIDEAVPMCIHPRKVLPADYNQDGVLDFIIVCHGYDAPPFPGERNRIVLSQSNGRYKTDYLTTSNSDTGFYHGGSANDFNSDGYPDVIVTTFNGLVVYLNDKTGKFVRSTEYALPSTQKTVFQIEAIDVNNDGKFDLVYGAIEWGYAEPTAIEINPGSNKFTGTPTMIIPAVDGARIILDFVYSKNTNSVYVLRTGGTAADANDLYKGVWIQKFSVTDKTSTVVYSNPTFVDPRDGYSTWIDWIIERNGAIMSDFGGLTFVKQ
jgi:hypothetical protein